MLTSIIIDNYNYAQFLPEAIASALAQTYSPLEIIIVDDGSTDGSRDLISQFGGQVKLVFKDNGGQASAFNAGFQAAQGEMICFLDSDDYFYPHKVEQMVQLFQTFPDAGWCFHELDDVDANGQILKAYQRHRIRTFERVDLRQTLTQRQTLQHWFPATSGLCFRREILDGLFPIPDSFRVSADSFIRLGALYSSPGILVPEVYATHRQHGGNLYDFRSDVHVERVKLGVRTAYYLSQKFPETQPFTDRQFQFCIGKLIEYIPLNEALKIKEIKLYLQQKRSFLFWSWLFAYATKASVKKMMKSLK